MTYGRDLSGKAAIAAVQYGKEGKYWLKKFSGELPKTTFPYDYMNWQPDQQKKDYVKFALSSPCVSTLMKLSKALDYRLYIILAASLVTLLYKYTGNKDIIIGSPIFKQDKEGNFINTMLPLRNPVDGAMIFKELLLDHVRQTIIEANQHQNYPIETLLFQLNMTVIREKFPLFDVVILLENIHEKKYIHSVHPNVVFSFLRTNDGIEGKVEYNPALYRPDTIDRIVHHFERLLEQVLVSVNIFISEIDILGGKEKKQILYDFNKRNQQARYPHHKTLHQLFVEQVERTPHHLALLGQGAERQAQSLGEERCALCARRYAITYRELNEKSNQLAHLLIEKGVKPDTIVGIMVERFVEMIIDILGILKAGGAYLSIDPDYPQERINYMLADSEANILLTTHNLSGKFEKLSIVNCQLLMVNEESRSINNYQLIINNLQLKGNNLAYVIYTSGTTGRPKGSLIEHRNVVSLMAHENHLFDFGSRDVWTMFHSYCFDFSVWEMYGALLYGGKLVLISKMTARDPQQHLQTLKAEQVTILNQTPPAFYQLAQQELDSPGRNLRLKYVILGGEALTPAKLKPWKEKYPETKLINMFGITETTVHVTYKEIDHNDIKLNISNIGGPLPTLNVYIVDWHQKLLPIGVPGELCVSGAGVCRGYLNQPGLTAEKFDHDLWDVQDYRDGYHRPYRSYKSYIYRSGDLARWLPCGNIEYLGRIDQQVKIRGYRVELGEIEAQLMRHYAVKEAAALEREDSDGLKTLNAYVVPDPKYAYSVKQLTELERADRLENQLHHEYPNGMSIFHINRHETDFMYREIFEEQSYIQHGITLEEGACIFDVGANIGMFSLFVQYTCKNPKIYAFEPIPPIFEMLSLNTSIYCKDIEVFHCGLSQNQSEAVFTYYPHAAVLSGRFADQSQEIQTVKAFIKNESKENPEEEQLSEDQVNELLEDRLKNTSFTCKMKSLSQIIREKGIDKIDLLKIDVEKAEIDVLKGIDDEDWPKIRQLVIEVHDVDEALEKITQQLRRRGYRVVVQQDSELRNTNLCNVYAVSENKPSPGNQEAAIVKRNEPVHHDRYLSPGRFIDDLRTFLEEKIPGYMVPSYFVLLDYIPLNPNGKVDGKALPNPQIKTGKAHLDPRNQVEIKLVEIWAEILGIEKDAVGIDSDFFQLGGHSLKATIFISRLHKILDVKVPLAVLFKTPTIRDISEYISKLKRNRFISLEAVEKKDYYPLSSAQKRLYVLQQMELASIAYNVPQVYELGGELNKKTLENTFRQLIKRHESLRTSFDIIKGKPVQKIHQEVKFEMEYYQVEVEVEDKVKVEVYEGTGGLAPLSEELAAPNPQPAAALISSFIRPFDLSNAPLLRVGLIKEENQKHILMVDMQHIITDGTSMDLFVKESMALYAGEELPPLRFQYKDYSQWQNSAPYKKALKKQEKYWIKQFEEEVPILDMPLNYPRPEIQRFEGDILSSELSIESTGALKQLALDTGTTLYMVLLAIYNVLLSKLSRQEDIVVGTPIAARRHVNLEHIIGMFVNTLAMRNYPAGNKKFVDFLEELKKRTLEAFENQEYQFDDLVEKVFVNRDTSRNPIFDVLFGLQNMESQASEIPVVDISQLQIRPYEEEHRTAKFDLNLTCFENEDKLFCFFEYCTKLFKKGTIERFIIYFKQIISAVLENHNQKISQIEIITAEEKRRILEDFNNTTATYPEDKPLHQLFSEQVKHTPDHIALVGMSVGVGTRFIAFAPGKPYVHLTYSQLHEKSNQLANLLIEKGVKPDTIVGIMVERSLEMIIGILGILKAGGAYMPTDPDYPEERINYMFADSSAKILVTSPVLSEKFEKLLIVNCQLLMVNEIPPNRRRLNNPPKEANSISNYQLTINNLQLKRADLAYIIYTSGTTGKPKGSLVEHRNVVSLMSHDNYLFEFDINDVWTMFHSYCFDFSVWEMYGALLYGGKLILIPKITARDPQQYLEILKKEKVTILNQTPAAFYQLAQQELENPARNLRLKYVIFGGEALTPSKLKPWKEKYPETKLINMFGITETTVHVTFKEIDQKDIQSDISNIGTPLPTLNTYVMDKHQRMMPIGVPGELTVSGEGVCRGYLNRPELTAEKFNQDLLDYQDYHDKKNQKFLRGGPGGAVFSKRVPPGRRRQNTYKTGDLGKLAVNGELEYLGRIDHQVKIRGYRIETAEIEQQLLRINGIKKAVVIGKQDKNNIRGKYLCAFIVGEPLMPEKEFTALGIKEHLSRWLPDYMIPQQLVTLEEIPLTANGKIDRKALLEMDISFVPGDRNNYTAPRDEKEKILAGIWSTVLNIEKVGIYDNFFSLGGDSISSIIVISRAREKGLHISTHRFFQHPTIDGVIKNMDRKEPAEQQENRSAVDYLQPFALISRADQENLPPGIEDAYPLRMRQVDFLIQHESLYGNSFLNFILSYKIKERFHGEMFEKAVQLLVECHPIFRTTYDLKNYSQYLQLVHKKIPLPLVIKDLREVPPEEQEEILKSARENEKNQPIDWEKPGLIGFMIHILDDEAFHFICRFHNSAVDGWSQMLIITELFTTYRLLIEGTEFSQGLELEASFKDAVARELEGLTSDKVKKYWRDWLAGSAFKRIQRQSGAPSFGKCNRTGLHPVTFPPGLSAQLKKTAESLQVPIKIVMLTAHCVVMGILIGSQDIVTGYEVNVRPEKKDGDKIAGVFTNIIPFRLIISNKNHSWSDLTQKVHQAEIELIPYKYYPLAQIKEDLRKQELFESVFNFTHFRGYKTIDDSIDIESTLSDLIPVSDYTLRAEFGLDVLTDDAELNLIYYEDVLSKDDIKFTADCYLEVLQQMAENPSGSCELLQMTNEKNKK
ncbi:MAG: amino acid adenylation domain-containing protein [Candidatus Aminicenantes bacterium]|jgi:amino acid adenylation domain-containing protein/FkbM family methyltransferase